MFKRILIANRGEIAVRIIRTLKEMGIETVAIYSEADERSLHVFEADQAHLVGPAEPLQSYLHIPRIIEIAKRTHSEAIHPGYGFLAENPRFAKACEEEGIAFIGPHSGVIELLGDKVLSRRLAEGEGVPIIPGMLESTTDLNILRGEARKIGYPLIIKAALGGGGKGMRVVEGPDQLEEACASAIREAEMAFGDGRIYLEALLKRPRHVEFQILGDKAGNVIHLFERECSVQRRHQKILEETPSPALFPELREEMAKAAVKIARAAGYTNAGTVEFLLDSHLNFYFLEVNTRLQVEHPITEMSVGMDLVRQQVEIAWGIPLNLRQEDIRQVGHSIECRVYGEDPQKEFLPSPGPILGYREPSGPGVRVDSGIYEGYEVPIHYDPILSKLIVWAEDREAARRRMLRALQSYVVAGIPTTIPFLMDLVASMAFLRGDTHIGFLEEHFSGWNPPKRLGLMAAVAATVASLGRSDAIRPRKREGGLSPWEYLGGWEL